MYSNSIEDIPIEVYQRFVHVHFRSFRDGIASHELDFCVFQWWRRITGFGSENLTWKTGSPFKLLEDGQAGSKRDAMTGIPQLFIFASLF